MDFTAHIVSTADPLTGAGVIIIGTELKPLAKCSRFPARHAEAERKGWEAWVIPSHHKCGASPTGRRLQL